MLYFKTKNEVEKLLGRKLTLEEEINLLSAINEDVEVIKEVAKEFMEMKFNKEE